MRVYKVYNLGTELENKHGFFNRFNLVLDEIGGYLLKKDDDMCSYKTYVGDEIAILIDKKEQDIASDRHIIYVPEDENAKFNRGLLIIEMPDSSYFCEDFLGTWSRLDSLTEAIAFGLCDPMRFDCNNYKFINLVDFAKEFEITQDIIGKWCERRKSEAKMRGLIK